MAVKALRRTLSLALLALLLVLVAGPVAAAQCEMRGACPMMAKVARPAPCHDAAGSSGMTAPMDCCRPVAAPAPTSVLPGLEPLPAAVLATLPAASAADRVVAVPFSRAGQLHPLGLFTLHSVWRI